jgi:hypothetical protein
MGYALGFLAFIFILYWGGKFVKNFLTSTFRNLRIFLGFGSNASIEIEYIESYGTVSCILFPILILGLLFYLFETQINFSITFIESMPYSNLSLILLILLTLIFSYAIWFFFAWIVGKLILLKFSQLERSLLYFDLSKPGWVGNKATIFVGQTLIINAFSALIIFGCFLYILYLLVRWILIPAIQLILKP